MLSVTRVFDMNWIRKSGEAERCIFMSVVRPVMQEFAVYEHVLSKFHLSRSSLPHSPHFPIFNITTTQNRMDKHQTSLSHSTYRSGVPVSGIVRAQIIPSPGPASLGAPLSPFTFIDNSFSFPVILHFSNPCLSPVRMTSDMSDTHSRRDRITRTYIKRNGN
jgi:hypothetical protein